MGGGGHKIFDHQIGGSQKYCRGTFGNLWPPHSKENGAPLIVALWYSCEKVVSNVAELTLMWHLNYFITFMLLVWFFLYLVENIFLWHLHCSSIVVSSWKSGIVAIKFILWHDCDSYMSSVVVAAVSVALHDFIIFEVVGHLWTLYFDVGFDGGGLFIVLIFAWFIHFIQHYCGAPDK